MRMMNHFLSTIYWYFSLFFPSFYWMTNLSHLGQKYLLREQMVWHSSITHNCVYLLMHIYILSTHIYIMIKMIIDRSVFSISSSFLVHSFSRCLLIQNRNEIKKRKSQNFIRILNFNCAMNSFVRNVPKMVFFCYCQKQYIKMEIPNSFLQF